MYAAPSLTRVPCLSARLTLRPYQPTDVELFFCLLDANRPRLQPAFPARLAAVQTRADAAQVLYQFDQDWETGHLYVFGIWHTTTGRYLGDISLRPSWRSPVTGEIGYYLSAEAEGHGYAREALAAMVEFGFTTLRAAHLLIRCRDDNPRSCAVAEAVGFHPVPPQPHRWALGVRNATPIRYYVRKQTGQ